MFNKTKKKELEKVIVYLIDESKSSEVHSREYLIPKNGTAKIDRIGGHLTLKDDKGDTTYKIRWQAGYTQEYEFIYKKE